MSENETNLRLVDSLDSGPYDPELIYMHALQDRNDSSEVSITVGDLKAILALIDIKEYKLLVHTDSVHVYLTKVTDYEKLSVAMDDERPRTEYYTLPEDTRYSPRLLEELKNELRGILDNTELRDSVDVRLDHPNKRIVVEAHNNLAYLKLLALNDNTAELAVDEDDEDDEFQVHPYSNTPILGL